jgi:hypothetical protein
MGSGTGRQFVSSLSPNLRYVRGPSSSLEPATHPAGSLHSGDPRWICSVGLHPLHLLCMDPPGLCSLPL